MRRTISRNTIWIGSWVVGALTLLSAPFALGQRKLVDQAAPLPTRSERLTQERPQPGGDAPITVTTDLVSLTVTITDREGRHVSGLGRNAFTVLDEGVTQQISFFSDADVPVSIGVIFDTSGSMSGKKIGQAREALAQFIQVSHPLDEYFLIGFSSQPQLLTDRTRDADAVLRKLTYVEPHGDTALYDAVYLGVEKVGNGIHPKRVLLVISDGEDNNSRYSFGDLRRALEESDVVVYAVGIRGNYPLKARGYVGRETLEKLTKTTGGKAFFPENNDKMSDAFERIALELRRQYSIVYRPENFAVNGKWHRVKITLGQAHTPRLVVRSRAGYYAIAGQR